jgi:hypothetical protein
MTETGREFAFIEVESSRSENINARYHAVLELFVAQNKHSGAGLFLPITFCI